MKFFDKVKSMFTEEAYDEEVEDEVKVEQIKKEVTHIPIESPNAQEEVEEVVVEEVKPEPTTNKSNIFFSDHDFDDLNKPRYTQVQDKKDEFFSKEELAKMYGSTVTKEKKEEKKEKEFHPTPIISPIYGILDKNYHKEDIVEKKDTQSQPYKSHTGYSIDSIRNKAYGTLEEQLKDETLNTVRDKNEDRDLFEELSKEKSQIVFDDDTRNKKKDSEEITMDLTKELDDLLQKKQASINATSRVMKNKDLANDEEKLDLFDMYEDGGEDI